MDESECNLCDILYYLPDSDIITQYLGLKDMSFLSQCNQKIKKLILTSDYYITCKELLYYKDYISPAPVLQLLIRNAVYSATADKHEYPYNDYEQLCITLVTQGKHQYFLRFVQHHGYLINLEKIYRSICKKGNRDVINFITNKMVASTLQIIDGVEHACRCGNIESFENIFKKYPDINFLAIIKSSFSYICTCNNISIVKSVLQMFPNIETKNEIMLKLFKNACVTGNYNMVRKLRRYYVSMGARDRRKIFQHTCRDGHFRVVQLLFDPTWLYEREFFCEILRKSIKRKNKKIVKWLLTICPTISILDSLNVNMEIKYSLKNDSVCIAKALMNKFSIQVPNIDFNSLFVEACKQCHLLCARFLYESYTEYIDVSDTLECIFETVCSYDKHGMLSHSCGYFGIDQENYVFEKMCFCVEHEQFQKKQLEMSNFLLEISPDSIEYLLSDYNFITVCKHGNLSMVQWMWSIRSKIKQYESETVNNAFSSAFDNQHGHIVVWFYQIHGAKISEKITQQFKSAHLLKFTVYISENVIEIKHDPNNIFHVFSRMCLSGHTKTAKIIWDTYTDICKKKFLESKKKKSQWYLCRYDYLDLNFCSLVKKTARRYHLRTVRWLCTLCPKETSHIPIVDYRGVINISFKPREK